MTSRYSYIKKINYLWRSPVNEHRMQTSKDVRPVEEILGENFHSLFLNLSGSWTREEYITWVQHWKLCYNALTRAIQKTKKWRKTSLITLDSQEVSKARSKERQDMRLWASSLMSLRNTSKILAENAFRTLPNH